MALTQEERELAARIGFDEEVLEVIRAEANCSFERIRTDEVEHECKPALWVRVQPREGDIQDSYAFDLDGTKTKLGTLLTEQGQGRQEQLRQILKQRLSPLGYKVFDSLRTFDPGFNGVKHTLVVLKTEDPFDVLRTINTDGANYDIQNSDVIVRLQDWDSRYGLEIIGARHDAVALELQKVPDDVLAFAQEVYEFCPDIIDQGYASAVEELDEDGEDIEEVLELNIKARSGEISSQELMSRLMELQPTDEERDDLNQRALKLLADDVRETGSLFLWWD